MSDPNSLRVCRLCFANVEISGACALSNIRRYQQILEGLSGIAIPRHESVPEVVCRKCEDQIDAAILLRRRILYTEKIWAKLQETKGVQSRLQRTQHKDLLLNCHMCGKDFAVHELRPHIATAHGIRHLADCDLCCVILHGNTGPHSNDSDNLRPKSTVDTNESVNAPPYGSSADESEGNSDGEYKYLNEVNSTQGHVNAAGRKIKYHACHMCPKTFNRPVRLRHHIEEHHPATNQNVFFVKQEDKEDSDAKEQNETGLEAATPSRQTWPVSIVYPGRKSRSIVDKRFHCPTPECQRSYTRSNDLRRHVTSAHKIILGRILPGRNEITGETLNLPHLGDGPLTEPEAGPSIQSPTKARQNKHVNSRAQSGSGPNIAIDEQGHPQGSIQGPDEPAATESTDKAGERNQHADKESSYILVTKAGKRVRLPYCHPCKKAFHRPCNLRAHQLQCNGVDATARYNNSLMDISERIVDPKGNPVRQYKCTRCTRSYPRTNQLRQHMSTAHNLTLPFKFKGMVQKQKALDVCHECGMGMRPRNLRAHMLRIHNIVM